MFQGVIFDLDGTIADTLDSITAGVNAGMAALDLDPHDPQQVRRWVGDGIVKLMERAIPPDQLGRLDEIVGIVSDHYRHHHVEQARLYPGIAAMLETLDDRGITMSVLSNKPHEFTLQLVAALFSSWSITGILGAVEDAKRKPDPAGALSMAQHMNLNPDQILFVGDSATDIQTAANADMKSVAVTWGFRDRDELVEARPDWIIDTPDLLIPIVLGDAVE